MVAKARHNITIIRTLRVLYTINVDPDGGARGPKHLRVSDVFIALL